MSEQQTPEKPELYDGRTRMAGLDVITAIVMFIFGGGVAYVSWTMKIFNRSRVVSPGLFPLILGFMFMFLAVLMGGLALRRNGWKAAGFMLSPDHIKDCLASPRFARGGVILLAIFVYVFLFGKIHFIAATALYLVFNFLYLKALSIPKAVVLSVAAAFVIFAIFKYGFGIPIP